MENASAGTLSPGDTHDWLDAATAVLKGVWSAARAFHGALHKQPPRKRAKARREEPEPAAAPGPPSWLDQGELPESYGRTKVVAMVVSPYMVHVYWDLAKKDSALTDPASLRFHEAGGTGSFDVSVNLATKNWYVHLWSPEKRYYVELGVERAGEFSQLARSNTIETPRAWPVAEVREQFARSAAPPPVETNVPGGQDAEVVRRVQTPEAADAKLPLQTGTGTPGFPPRVPQKDEFPLAASPTPPPPPHTPALTDGGRVQEPIGATTDVPRPEADPTVPSETSAVRLTATDILRRRLAEFYAFRRWRPRPGPSPEPEIVEPSMALLLDPTGESVAADLTGRIESQFTPGFSSALLAAKKPAE